jgi:hypothetical protein
MKIHNHREYTIAYEKAAIMIDADFGGNFATKRYFREIITAIMAYEKISTHQIFPETPVSMSV